VEEQIRRDGLPDQAEALAEIKGLGFSDARLARLTGQAEPQVTAHRLALGVHPVFKRIDTCAAEFEARTPYLYSCYEPMLGGQVPECEAMPSERRKVIILGGGPNRIGQGIEFDYCCCHAAFGLAEAGIETIMVNCNPETVSTDYDTSDRLYFEPLTAEDVLAVARVEASAGTLCGVIVQLGGQTPLKLAKALEDAGIPILGTSPDAIDLAEDRERCQKLLERLQLRQPPNDICFDQADALAKAERVGFPVVIRPSYVLGGRAMRIVHDPSELAQFIGEAARLSNLGPILIDGYLEDAIEIDVDVVADGESVLVAGIMEHIEEAGIHSGDSACSLPPYSLDDAVLAEIRRQAEALARALEVRGLMNVQMAIKDGEVFILEVNPRASRTVPFVAKAIGWPVAKVAARVMAGERLADFAPPSTGQRHVAVKEAVFPFAQAAEA
jgi:carbamoyl-phosphate synthase large subunit